MLSAITIFDPVLNAIGAILAFFYGLVPNLGVSIILLTFLIMAALFPLTAKQAKSMIEMQRVQPELKKLQAKYKNDRQKMNEEVMKFYQEHKINPIAGCLPLVAQMPIFIALYNVIRTPFRYVPLSSDLYQAFCGNAPEAACGKAPLPHHLSFLGMDLQISASGAHNGFGDALPYFLLVGLVVVTGFLQSRQSSRSSGPNVNPQMQMITKVLPVVFGLISINFPAGLVLYFLVSNIWRLGQQEYILRHFHGVGAKPKTIDVKGADVDGSSNGGGWRDKLKTLGTGTVEAPEPEPEPNPEPNPEAPKRKRKKKR